MQLSFKDELKRQVIRSLGLEKLSIHLDAEIHVCACSRRRPAIKTRFRIEWWTSIGPVGLSTLRLRTLFAESSLLP